MRFQSMAVPRHIFAKAIPSAAQNCARSTKCSLLFFRYPRSYMVHTSHSLFTPSVCLRLASDLYRKGFCPASFYALCLFIARSATIPSCSHRGVAWNYSLSHCLRFVVVFFPSVKDGFLPPTDIRCRTRINLCVGGEYNANEVQLVFRFWLIRDIDLSIDDRDSIQNHKSHSMSDLIKY